MTKDEAIQTACEIMSLAYHSIGDYTQPSDGFCAECPATRLTDWRFQNNGHALEYVRRAVVEKLKRDGHEIAFGFDENGRARRDLLTPPALTTTP